MKKISVCFFGTHDFAATILEGLSKSSFLEIKMVITQPDKPVGRKQALTKSPVKILAEKLGLKIQQPATLKNYELGTENCELGIVTQYGLLIPTSIIESFPDGILNVHTSLLPKYRGASPIQTALMNGEKKTGVTIMQLNEGLDTGSIISQKEQGIDPDDTHPTLEKKLVTVGTELLLETIPLYINKTILPQPQDETKATLCTPLTRDQGRVDWKKTASEIYNQYRGLTPWPGVWTTLYGKRVKLLSLSPSNERIDAGKMVIENGKVMVGSSDGSLVIHTLQFEGKKAMESSDIQHGYAHLHGHYFV